MQQIANISIRSTTHERVRIWDYANISENIILEFSYHNNGGRAWKNYGKL